MNCYKKIYLWLFLLFVTQGVMGQYFDPFQNVEVLKNTTLTIPFSGYLPQVVRQSHATVSIIGTRPNYTLQYVPDSSYTGSDTLIMEYRDSPDWFRSKLLHLSLVVDVVSSTVRTQHDYFVMEAGDTLLADVLTNDLSSLGSLHLTAIPIDGYGQVSVMGDSIEFIPTLGFHGHATFQYRACDSLGVCKNGDVTVLVQGGAFLGDSLLLTGKQNMDIEVCLPEDDFTIVDSSGFGDAVLHSDFVLQYSPDENYYGRDSIRLVDSFGRILYISIQILEQTDSRHTLVDDVVYTAINHEVWVDVQKNDVTDNFAPRAVRRPGRGTLHYVDSIQQFKYRPPLDVESIESFDYTLRGGKVDEEATATIYINDGHPDASGGTYYFETPKDKKLVLRYDLPFKEHNFNLKYRIIGQMDIYNQDTTVYVDCDTVSGSHFMVFTPGRHYLGNHYFTIEHCVEGTSLCEDVDIVIKTINQPAGSCYCMNDCVWAGDVNYDGRVDMKDLLPLAHHLGQTGVLRSNGTTSWQAQSAVQWNQTIEGSKVDLKHADTDGNGSLSVDDATTILGNYHKEHAMVPSLVGPSRSYAWYLIPRFDTVRAGELAVIDVAFGNASHPIADMEGVAYTVNFSPHVTYDSTTLHVTHHPASFLTQNHAFIGLDIQPVYRRLDVGVTNTSGSTASGHGVINTVDFIVEDDLVGIKTSSRYVTVPLEITGATGMASDGTTFALPDARVNLVIDRGETRIPFSPDNLIVWPNPAQGVFNIHLHGQDEMLSAELYSAEGQLMLRWDDLHPDHQRMVVPTAWRGTYLLRVKTTAGVVTKKVQLLGH